MTYFHRFSRTIHGVLARGPSRWLFARGWSIWMITCQRLVHPGYHLLVVGPSGWWITWGRSIWMIIWKRPVHPDDHLQEAGPFRWSFARGWSIWMIICKMPVHLNDYQSGRKCVIVASAMRAEQGPCEPIKGCVHENRAIVSQRGPEYARGWQWEPVRARVGVIGSHRDPERDSERSSKSQREPGKAWESK